MSKRKRGYGGGTLDHRTARTLQGFRLKGAASRYHARLDKIDADLREQRKKCAETYEQTKARLDEAIAHERKLIAEAKADKAKAVEKRNAATARLAADRAEKRAKLKHARDTCKLDRDALRAKKKAEAVHHAEQVAIEKSALRPQQAERRTMSSAQEREQVIDEIPDEYKPLWLEVRRSFKIPARAEGRSSLAEAFLEFAASSSDAVAAAQQRAADRAERELQREQAKQYGGRGRGRRAQLPDAPF